MNDLNRHLVRKYLQIVELPKEVQDVIASAPIKELSKKEKKEKKQSALLTKEGEYIKSFIYNTIPIPSVHPVPVYFEMALRQLEYLKSQKQQVINEARANQNLDKMLSNMYFFFGTASIFASQITSSIECFINLRINDRLIYHRQKDSKEMIGNDNLWVSLKEKIEFLIIHITELKDFEKSYPNELDTIKSLIDFRNKCVHPKKDEEFAMDNYENLFCSSLSFNYEKSIIAVQNFINYYADEIIVEECLCQQTNEKETA